MKKVFLSAVLVLVMASTAAFARGDRDITYYEADTALHPFKVISLALRPPLALLNVFVRGGYYFIDSHPIRRAFNTDTRARFSMDEDY